MLPGASRTSRSVRCPPSAALLSACPARHPADGVAGIRAGHRRHPAAEARAQRRHPRPQLHDAGDLPLRRDIVGDSLLLAREAQRVDADVIVMAGVHFMAETAKLLNPGKTVLIPDVAAGCSLAESITAADVRLLRQRYPGLPVVTYVNTSADVKAESDICCTSGNAKRVIESLGVPEVIMLPDQYLAANVARETGVQHHLLGRVVRGARALHPGPDTRAAGGEPGRGGAGASGMPARRGRRGRFRRLDRGDGRLRDRPPARPRGADHRMLDGGQHRRAAPEGRFRAAVQPVPAHEAHHPARPAPLAGDADARGDDRSGGGRPGAPGRRKGCWRYEHSAHSARRWLPDHRRRRAGRADGRPAPGARAGAGAVAAPLGEQAASGWAQGGLAAAIGADDSPSCIWPTRWPPATGCATRRGARIVEAGPALVEELARLGARFDRARTARSGSAWKPATAGGASSTRRRWQRAGDPARGDRRRARHPRITVWEGVPRRGLVLRDGAMAGVLAHGPARAARACCAAAAW